MLLQFIRSPRYSTRFHMTNGLSAMQPSLQGDRMKLTAARFKAINFISDKHSIRYKRHYFTKNYCFWDHCRNTSALKDRRNRVYQPGHNTTFSPRNKNTEAYG